MSILTLAPTPVLAFGLPLLNVELGKIVYPFVWDEKAEPLSPSTFVPLLILNGVLSSLYTWPATLLTKAPIYLICWIVWKSIADFVIVWILCAWYFIEFFLSVFI